MLYDTQTHEIVDIYLNIEKHTFDVSHIFVYIYVYICEYVSIHLHVFIDCIFEHNKVYKMFVILYKHMHSCI